MKLGLRKRLQMDKLSYDIADSDLHIVIRNKILIQIYNPEHILLIGIAAGVRNDVNYGDVVISQSVIGYEFEKLKPKKHSPKPRSKEPSFELVQDNIFFIPWLSHNKWIDLIKKSRKLGCQTGLRS